MRASRRGRRRRGRVCAVLHGCTHADAGGRPEFAAPASVREDNLRERLRRGRAHLEDALGVRITTFAPPHNRLSLDGYRAVRAEGLHLLALPSVRGISRPLSWPVVRTIAVRVWYHAIWRCEYPRPVFFDGHWELGCQPLTPRTNLQGLAAARHVCRRRGWPLALATHYWELDAPLGGGTVRDVLSGVFSAMEHSQMGSSRTVRLVCPDEIFQTWQAGAWNVSGP